METKEKVRLLRSLHLFERIPEDKLAILTDYLEPHAYDEDEIIFEEGSKGDSLYLVSSGRIRIMKKVLQADGTPAFKDLAILHAGDCFGEMALFDDVPRSARATAGTNSILFELGRKDLHRWLDLNPQLAIGFFTELVQVLSKRLRRSSNELTLLFDLSQWLLEPLADGGALLRRVLSHLTPHLEGSWTAGAYLYNEFNDEMELVASEGKFEPAAFKPSVSTGSSPLRAAPEWIDERTFMVFFPAEKHPAGYLLLRSASPLNIEEKNEITRTLTTTARLITSALENIGHRAETALRTRLAASKDWRQ